MHISTPVQMLWVNFEMFLHKLIRALSPQLVKTILRAVDLLGDGKYLEEVSH